MNEIKKIIASAFSLESGSDTPEGIREKMLSGAQVRGTNMCILVLAIFIASIGLNMNSTAVIIGAMLISPLMGGIMAIGYGIAVNDLTLARKAFLGLAFQIFLCIVTSAVYFSLSPISTAHSELLARTTPTVWDVMIALFGGLAGIIGVTREEKTNVLPGVAIATALMPPLCTAGYGIATRSLQFFGGAMYLFFINSFFICISTVLISRVMHLPRKKFVDKSVRNKAKAIIWTVAVVTVLPSIYLAYQIVGKSIQENNIDQYIAREFSFPDTQVVRSSVDQSAGEIRVALLGKRLNDERIAELQSAMPAYGLSDMKLRVTQTELTEGVSYADIQTLIEHELVENAKETNLVTQNKKIEELQGELVQYKMQVLEYQNAYDYDVEALSREICALHPQITHISIGRQKIWEADSDDVATGVMVTIKLPEKMPQEECDQLARWIEVKIGASPVMLYQDAPDPEPEDPQADEIKAQLEEADAPSQA